MIVSKDIHPERDMYYLGASAISILKDQSNDAIDYFYLYKKMKSSHDLSINLFNLVLDWLYLLGVIDLDNKRQIVKCF